MFQVPPWPISKRTRLPPLHLCYFISLLKASLFHITCLENNQVEEHPSVTEEQEEIQVLSELGADIIESTQPTIRSLLKPQSARSIIK